MPNVNQNVQWKIPYSTSGVNYLYIDQPPNVYSNSGVYTITGNNYRYGQGCFNWRLKIRGGTDATTVCNGVKQTVEWSPGTLTTRLKMWPTLDIPISVETSVGAPLCVPQSPSHDTVTSLHDQAILGVLRKIDNYQRQFQGGVFAGEIGEAIGLVMGGTRGLAKELTKYFKKAKRVRGKINWKIDWKRKNKQLSELWLEHNFGIAPLLGDIDDAMHALATALNRVPRRQIVSYTARSTTVDSKLVSSNTVGNYGYYTQTSTTTTERMCRVKAMIEVDVLGHDNSGFDLFGIGFSNFVPTVWELLPWSFVVDYFTNVGNILQAVTVDISTVRWACITDRAVAIHRVETLPDQEAAKVALGNKLIGMHGSLGTSVAKYYEYTRSPCLLQLSSSALTFGLPGLKQLSNLGALGGARHK
jgi:hypothetical protein